MFRLSIPIKVLLIACISYAASLLLSSALTIHFQWDVENLLLIGIPLHYFLTVLPIFIGVLSAAIATHFLLDRPLLQLARTMMQAGKGDFLIRAPVSNTSQVGLLATQFNKMLAKLTDMAAHKIETDHDLIVAQEELKYKKRLEEKSQMIEKTNRTLENLVKDLSSLYEIGQGINQTIDLEQLYQVLTDVLKRQLRLDEFSLMIWDEKHQLLRVKAAFGFEDLERVMNLTFKSREGIVGEVMHTGEMISVEDATNDRRFVRRGKVPVGSILSIPLSYKGAVLGVVNFGRHRVQAFSSPDMKMLTLVANQVALAIANARLYTQTRELSVTDELTGVFNRRHFGQVLQLEWKRAVRFKRELSLLMCDVDYFKRYNDTKGHLEGDTVLKKLGALLGTNLREVDTAARFGGEEFIVLLPDTDKRGAVAVAEKLRYMVQEKIKDITISVGVASYPDDAMEMDDLIDHADIALYDAKDKGRNQVVTYIDPKKPNAMTGAAPSDNKPNPNPKTRLVH